MQVTTFTKPKAVITILTAVFLIIDPNIILNLFGAQLEAAGVMMTRVLGGAYLVSGIGIWSINGPRDISTRDSLMYAAGETVAAISIFIGIAAGALNLLGWLLAFAYVGFVWGFLFVARETQQLDV